MQEEDVRSDAKPNSTIPLFFGVTMPSQATLRKRVNLIANFDRVIAGLRDEDARNYCRRPREMGIASPFIL